MNPVAWISRYLPNWSIVMGAAGLVGAVAAIVAVAVYRDVLEDSGSAVPVKSEVPDG